MIHLSCRAAVGSFDVSIPRVLSSRLKANAAANPWGTLRVFPRVAQLGQAGDGPGEVRIQPDEIEVAGRPMANWPTGLSMWNSIPVILAKRSTFAVPIAHPPRPISTAVR